MMLKKRIKPVITPDDIRADLDRFSRRAFLRGSLSLGGLAMLTGCNLSTDSGVDAALKAILRFDDKVQAKLFDPARLAQTYPASAITDPFRFNAYYPDWQVRGVPDDWRLEVAGQVTDKKAWTLDALQTLPQESQITRHICIEGWSQIGQWRGVPLAVFLRKIGADTRAKYVKFTCFDDYTTSIDMASALHPQTILALEFIGKPLSPEWGAPVRLRIPTKLGFKSAKNLRVIEVTNSFSGGYWENQGYDWFAGV
ncbi:molybdopterin-dependent oxidoreductase [uncultured Thalassospira sp.]|jgi:DMSO/TMAO reductase YedYZ molybdopterin-dependent catalytic subunit|uniref:molybdopterin-dependent oxidoreductase n=1 Tax=uncultured Thalassospira sp. TaxID=404382 RepID=UPI0030DB145F|tara:strand:+ start:7065 stop:7826 length:762 start_codon:yes stop_codon:yes gene_type:complete